MSTLMLATGPVMGQPSIRHRALGMLWFHTPDKSHVFISHLDFKVASAVLLADAGLPHATRGLRTSLPSATFDGMLSAPGVGTFAEHWLTEAVIRQKHLADQGRAGVSVMKAESSPPDHIGINPLRFWRASARKLHSERRASQPPADAERMSPTRGAEPLGVIR